MPMVGDGARVLVARAFDAARRLHRWSTRRSPRSGRATSRALPYTPSCSPACADVLDVATALGLPCAVVTNKPHDVTTLVLEALGIGRFFRAIWGGGDGPLKPSPAGVLDVVARLGVPASDAWMIGDGPQDIGAGKAAGLLHDRRAGDRGARAPRRERAGSRLRVARRARRRPPSRRELRGQGASGLTSTSFRRARAACMRSSTGASFSLSLARSRRLLGIGREVEELIRRSRPG